MPHPTQPAAPRARLTLALLALLSALAFMDRQILAVLLVPVKAEFGLSDLQVGLVTGLGFALTFGLIGVPLGRVADRRERRTLVAWCRGIGGALAALGATASGAWTLAFTRMGGAISDAGGGPASMSMIADLYPPESRSRAMSVFAMGASAGSLMALIGGAWFAQRHGWRATLAAIGLVTLAMALVLRWMAREPRRVAAPGPAVAPASGTAQQGAARAVLAQPVTRWLVVAAAFALLAGYSFGTWNFAYLVRVHGLEPQAAGWVTGLSALGSVCGTLASGALADRLTRRDARWQLGVPLIGIGVALPVGLAYLTLGQQHTGWVTVLVIAFGFFISWWVAPAYAALSLVVPPARRATANAMLLLVGAVGGSGIGPVLTGAVSDLLAGHVTGDPLRWSLALMVALLAPAWLAFAGAMHAYPAARRAALVGGA
ncbi:MAG: MFS transporter [Steroidobacteraceae bacterium]|jgi:MFS family permease|nr:MFS transporter [Rubrivivax sp.]MBP8102169.1 MFS transporter [Burkholderiaceae bacterium]